MNTAPEIVNEKRLFIDGYVYYRSGPPKGNKTHWECSRLWKKECHARATTITAPSGPVTVTKGSFCFKITYCFSTCRFLFPYPFSNSGPNESEHSHPPNREEAEAEKIKLNLKRKAETQPDRPPTAMLREELAGVSAGTVAQLPERENLKQSIRRLRNKKTDRSPTSLSELVELPEKYRKMVNGDQFLIHDSRDHDGVVDERVLVFSTKKNLQLLAASPMWFMDGTFKVNFELNFENNT